jgi:hypothetical protein
MRDPAHAWSHAVARHIVYHAANQARTIARQLRDLAPSRRSRDPGRVSARSWGATRPRWVRRRWSWVLDPVVLGLAPCKLGQAVPDAGQGGLELGHDGLKRGHGDSEWGHERLKTLFLVFLRNRQGVLPDEARRDIMRRSLEDKIGRVVRFLLGLRNPRVTAALAGHGFKQRDRDEGWQLVMALGKSDMAALPEAPGDTRTLLELDAWENRWFPIAQAALDRRFPAVSARFFLNLRQTEGPEVVISVRAFVERYDELAMGDAKYGPDAKDAQELLCERGLTPAVVAEAKTNLAALMEVAPPIELHSPDAAATEAKQAEAAMWSWYLEWSRIARVAIKQRALLKELGFLATKRGFADEESAMITGDHSP